MGRYNFTSVGGSAGKAIQEFMVERELKERQRMLDEQAKQKQQDDAHRQAAELTLRQEQEKRIAAAQQQGQDDLEKEREFRRASTIHTNALPGILDQNTADLLKRQGFGDIVTQGQPTQGAPTFDPTQVNEVPDYAVTPGLLETKGGTAYQQARAAEQARGEQATAAQQAAAERAAADRATRESIATEANKTREAIAAVAASGRGANADLDRQIKQNKIDTENQKQEDVAKAAGEGEKAIITHKNRVRDLVTKLYDPATGKLTANASRIFGPVSSFIPNVTGGANTAQADLDSLIASLDLNTLGELKRQSKTGATGFGSLSGPELGILESGGTTLRNRAQGEPAIAAELKRLLEATTDSGAAGGTVRARDPQGNIHEAPAGTPLPPGWVQLGA